MLRHLATVILATAMSMSCAAGSGQPAPKIQVNNGDITFRAILDRTQDTMQPKLGGGSVADPKNWPATVESGSDAIPCTATLLGPEVLLTAAHCVGDSAKATVKFDDGTEVTGTCRRHPDWNVLNESADWALCRMKKVDRQGLFFEHLSLDAAALGAGSLLTLAGYGCIDLVTQKRDGKLRTGLTVIKTALNPQSLWPHWLITEQATDNNGIFACPGDSGGAVYQVRADGSRRVVAVVSAVGADNTIPDQYKASFLATTSSGALASFLSTWRTGGQPLICGIPPHPLKCRPAPP